VHLGTSTRAAARRARRASRVVGIVVGQWHLGILCMPLQYRTCWLSTLPQDRVEHTHHGPASADALSDRAALRDRGWIQDGQGRLVQCLTAESAAPRQEVPQGAGRCRPVSRCQDRVDLPPQPRLDPVRRGREPGEKHRPRQLQLRTTSPAFQDALPNQGTEAHLTHASHMPRTCLARALHVPCTCLTHASHATHTCPARDSHVSFTCLTRASGRKKKRSHRQRLPRCRRWSAVGAFMP
jgi:hypothetical protein